MYTSPADEVISTRMQSYRIICYHSSSSSSRYYYYYCYYSSSSSSYYYYAEVISTRMQSYQAQALAFAGQANKAPGARARACA